ncbi:MAG: tetratricopeptide repeat protein, partial [Acidobacteria bacterium]|nr:tetratricopeptide repeat protein [Acidobacteriota bacterium]
MKASPRRRRLKYHLLVSRKTYFVILGFLILSLLSVSSWCQTADLVEKSRRGSELMRAGKFDEAVPIYQDLVRAVPNNPGLLLNLGLALHMAGQNQRAIPQFEAALKLDPNLLPASLFLGASHLRLGEPAKAVPPLQKVVKSQPEDREARQMLAEALFSLERFGAAAEHYRRLTELDPGNPNAWFRLGNSYEALAGRAFEELEKIAPDSAYWFALVADSRVAQRQFGSAFFFYRKALEADPTLPGVHAALAGVYRETGHPDWAAIEDEKESGLGAPDCGVKKLPCEFVAGRYQEVVASARDQKTAESYYW